MTIGAGGLTITGGSNDLVVLDIAHNSKFMGPATLMGGLTPDQVLFNVMSSGNNLSSSGNQKTNQIRADIIDLRQHQHE